MKRLASLLLLFLFILSSFSTIPSAVKAAPLNAAARTTIYLPLIMNQDPMTMSSMAAGPWTLVWSDEFNGTSLNTQYWSYDLGSQNGGWGNNELEYYTSRPQNLWVKNGYLTIQANQESYSGFNYTSARIKTLGLQSFQYGYIETRMKLPYGQGIWPTFWMVGTNGAWPQSGETDMVEYIGKHPASVDEALHGPSTTSTSGAFGIGNLSTLTTATLQNDFHVYGLEWQKNDLRWFIDNKLVFEETPATLPAGGQWVWNAPFYLILNLAVGGYYPGSPDATTVFPQQLVVDYVRYYQHP